MTKDDKQVFSFERWADAYGKSGASSTGPISCSHDANTTDQAEGAVSVRSPDASRRTITVDADWLEMQRRDRQAVRDKARELGCEQTYANADVVLDFISALQRKFGNQETAAPDNGLEGSERPANG